MTFKKSHRSEHSYFQHSKPHQNYHGPHHGARTDRDMGPAKRVFGSVNKAVQTYQSAMKQLKPLQSNIASLAVHNRSLAETKKHPVCRDAELFKYVDDYLVETGEKFKSIQSASDIALQKKIEALGPEDQIDKALIQEITAKHIPSIKLVPGTPGWNAFSKTLKAVQTRNAICMSIDIEAWERNPAIITEVGISIWNPSLEMGKFSISGPAFENHHIILEQALPLHNTQFMPDHKYNYLLGKSKIMSLKKCQAFIQHLIDHHLTPNPEEDAKSPTAVYERVFVGHGFSGDLKWLKTLQLTFPDNVPVFDTMKLFQSLYGAMGSGLGKALRLLQIPHAYMHNAGNDAYYTLRLLLNMCDIEKRRRLDLDNIEKIQLTIEEWRSHDSKGHDGNSKSVKRKRKMVSTEFQGTISS